MVEKTFLKSIYCDEDQYPFQLQGNKIIPTLLLPANNIMTLCYYKFATLRLAMNLVLPSVKSFG
ncbi:hypothetical protein AC791_12855 [Klebsiella sp. RIT-PI-d]|nr:hypothetical protein AC791_12855 [Klebsiella sp. RIT-PI-d]